MKYKVFKRCGKYYDEIFTKEKETKEIHIELDGVTIHISEQQIGMPLDQPQVFISVKSGLSYSMALSTLIKKLNK